MTRKPCFPGRQLSATTLAACAALSLAATAPAGGGEPEWFHGPFAAAMAKAKTEQMPVLIYFWKDGSDLCGKLYTESLATDDAAHALSDYVCYSARLDVGGDLFQQYGVRTMPTILFLDQQGNVEDGIVGYIERDGFFGEMERIKRGEGTVSNMRRKLAKAPDDLELRYKLALKLNDLGNGDAHDELIESIKKDDPGGRTSTGADLAWRETISEIFKSTNDAKEADLAPMYEFLAQCKHDEVLFAGWDWVSQIEYAKGNRVQMREAALKAWQHIPEDKMLDWGSETARKAWQMRDELSKKERKMALKIAATAVEQAEKWIAEHPAKGEGDEVQRFLARNLNTLACCLHMNDKRSDALKTMERVVELDPENEQYKTRLVAFRSK